MFDKFADQSNYYNYNPSLTNEEKTQIATEFLDSIIVKPFINILKVIISEGADVHAQVQKLKRYRDIEEKRRLELLQLAEGENAVMADVKPKEKEEKVSRREEKLAEIRNRKISARGRIKYGYRAAKKAMPMGYQQPVAQANDDDGKENFDKINGEKVLREFGPNGLRNAVHFLVSHPQKSLFDFIFSLGVNPDQPDYDEVTPFNLMSTNAFNILSDSNNHMLKCFLKADVRIDYPNRKGRTPFLNFYEKQNFELST